MEINSKGESIFKEYTSGTKEHLTSQVSKIAPDIDAYIKNFVFGEIYARQGINKQEKVLATITALAAMGGCETELHTHINTAINVKIMPKKIIDTLIQILPYAGFPRVINAISICKQVFKERNVPFDFSEQNSH
ncbi:carboxymuconolactone decarboxylase family protein [Lactiplantibacillus plantarum]|uniref:carboxymuconolactone decarboxylase family protein n=1 Tax=Lactiplantibacillus plantarum TaxID=1590 RepID=UPI001BAD6999|nr:carboxymuconolactone decarboxylase family protein [Lactiplantibacillus plantarum]MBS0953387.1 carboxymuconolactone decarboxylase family protein [Lactiplantibacillus plantarum]MBS0956471.1 carboxymuconolactone decarboxylase family protein [Lactiplantibacillus plantarum]